jgi:hypothetical protein
MDKYSKLISVYGKIWFAASVINAVISSFLILSSWDEGAFFIFFLSLIFSFILSIPILLIAVLLASFLLSVKVTENIFQVVLLVTFFVSIAGAICFKGFLHEVNSNSFSLCASIVLSAVLAVIIFQHKIKAINFIQE